MAMCRILLTLLCLLSLTTSAHAECAWVLWSVDAEMNPNVPIAQAQSVFHPSHWQPTRAYERATTCTAALNQAEQEASSRLLARNKDKTGMWQTTLYRCLPDTIDPRGPKGK